MPTEIPARIDVHLHIHAVTEEAPGDATSPVTVLLQSGLAEVQKMNTQLEILTIFLQRQGVKMTVMDDKLTALQVATAHIESAGDSVRAFVAGLPNVIQAAIDQARTAGATEAQMAAFDDLNARLMRDADAIVQALVIPGSQQTTTIPTPPDSGTTTPPADGGGDTTTPPADGGTTPTP